MVALARPHPRAEVRVVAGATLVRSKRQAKRSCASMPSVLRGHRPIFRQNLPVAGASLSLSVVASRGVACSRGSTRLRPMSTYRLGTREMEPGNAVPRATAAQRRATPRPRAWHGRGWETLRSFYSSLSVLCSSPLVSLSLSLVDMAYRTWPLVPAAARDGRSDSDADARAGAVAWSRPRVRRRRSRYGYNI